MKKIISLAIALLFLAALPGTMFAVENNQDSKEAIALASTRYTYIDYATCNLVINSSGKASMTATLDCDNSVDSTRISAYLQKYDSGWKTLKHWAQNYNSSYAAWGNHYYVASGYQYRVLVYYYAYSGSNTESTSLSCSKTY